MGVVLFPKQYNIEYVLNTPVRTPQNRSDYLKLCKRFLEEDDYNIICKSILDAEEYENAETQIQNIVKSYFSFNP